jgi:hypothetical protein
MKSFLIKKVVTGKDIQDALRNEGKYKVTQIYEIDEVERFGFNV